MRRRGGGKVILFLVLILLLIGITGGVQFWLWNNHVSKMDADYKEQIAELEAVIQSIGPLETVFTVVQNGLAGTEVVQSNITTVQVPKEFVKDQYILDPQEVVGKYYKVDIKPGTPLTRELVMEDEMDDTMREVDITALTWPVGLKVGDYVDFEITYPFGETFTVLSRVHVLGVNANTIKVKINGMQRHLYQAALVDYFLSARNGAAIHMNKYVEPGVQKAAVVYYAVPDNILSIIAQDPNIIQKADSAVNAQRRLIIEQGVAAVQEQIGGLINAGRMDLINRSNTATQEFWDKEKERLEKERLENLMNEQNNSTEGSLNIGPGVVE